MDIIPENVLELERYTKLNNKVSIPENRPVIIIV